LREGDAEKRIEKIGITLNGLLSFFPGGVLSMETVQKVISTDSFSDFFRIVLRTLTTGKENDIIDIHFSEYHAPFHLTTTIEMADYSLK
jgi:hypothetical protein